MSEGNPNRPESSPVSSNPNELPSPESLAPVDGSVEAASEDSPNQSAGEETESPETNENSDSASDAEIARGDYTPPQHNASDDPHSHDDSHHEHSLIRAAKVAGASLLVFFEQFFGWLGESIRAGSSGKGGGGGAPKKAAGGDHGHGH